MPSISKTLLSIKAIPKISVLCIVFTYRLMSNSAIWEANRKQDSYRTPQPLQAPLISNIPPSPAFLPVALYILFNLLVFLPFHSHISWHSNVNNHTSLLLSLVLFLSLLLLLLLLLSLLLLYLLYRNSGLRE